jgi:hypothetical protein
MLAVSLSVAISRRVSPLSMVEQQMMDEGFHPERSEGSSEGDRSSQEDPSLRSG